MGKNNKICVLGAGLWGTVLARHLARGGRPVWLWEFFPGPAERLERSRRHPLLPGVRLPPSVRVVPDIGEAAAGAEGIVAALPSAHVRSAARELARVQRGRPPRWALSASKGIEPGTCRTMSEILEEEIPGLRGRTWALSGPSFAREVARGERTRLVMAGPAIPAALAGAFRGKFLSVERSPDRKGVELCGSLKNVLAVGCGILDGLGAGANTKAAFLTQGLREMGALVRACGGRPATACGPSGLGDLIATGTSRESRNRAFGEKLGAGKSVRSSMREIPTVIEGFASARSAAELLRRRGVRAPLLEAIAAILHRGRPASRLPLAMGFGA